MPTTFDRAYFSFYLDGRERPFTTELDKLDLEPLAERVLNGEAPRDVAMSVAKDFAKKYELDGSEKSWAKKKSNREEIEVMGGDAKTAFAMYLSGMVDATAIELEISILEEADEVLNAATEDDDDDEDEDDEEDDGDDKDEDEDDKPTA